MLFFFYSDSQIFRNRCVISLTKNCLCVCACVYVQVPQLVYLCSHKYAMQGIMVVLWWEREKSGRGHRRKNCYVTHFKFLYIEIFLTCFKINTDCFIVLFHCHENYKIRSAVLVCAYVFIFIYMYVCVCVCVCVCARAPVWVCFSEVRRETETKPLWKW